MDPQNYDFIPTPSTKTGPSTKRVLRRKLTAEEAQAIAQQSNDEIGRAVLKGLSILMDSGPTDLSQALTIVRHGRLTLRFRRLAKQFYQLYREEMPYSEKEWFKRLKQVVRSLRRRYAELPDNHTNSFFKKLPELFDRLGRLAAVTGPLRLAPELIGEILNVVRVAASRILPREYGTGITDVDVEEVERHLLAFGADLGRSGAETEEAAKDVAKDLARFLRALTDYDPTNVVASDYALVNAGARLVVALAGANSLLGLLAQLNVYVGIRKLMPAREYADAMQRIGDAAEALVNDAQTDRLHKDLSRNLPEQEELPRASRLASYCRGNLIFTALSEALETVDRDKRKAWVVEAQAAADHVAKRDSAFHQVSWYRLAISAVADIDAPGEFKKFVGRVDQAKAWADLESIRAHFAHDDLIEHIESQFAKAK
jgi:hypothetical protein